MALSFASGFWQLTVPMSKGIDLDIKWREVWGQEQKLNVYIVFLELSQ